MGRQRHNIPDRQTDRLATGCKHTRQTEACTIKLSAPWTGSAGFLPVVLASHSSSSRWLHLPCRAATASRQPKAFWEHASHQEARNTVTTPSPSCTLLPVATPSALICWSGWSLICQWITQRDHWKSGISNGMSDVTTKIGKLNFKIKFWKNC